MRKLIAVAGTIITVGAFAGACWASAAQKAPHFTSLGTKFRYGFPQRIEEGGLRFANQAIPISRSDVRKRILQEINYLLLDRRSRVLLWLSRADYFKPVVARVLQKYKVPPEFLLLAAIESSFDPRALSSAGAYGYWQFIRATALCGPSGCDEYDWRMKITPWKDERADLVRSSHSAARYLAWLYRVKKINLDHEKPREGFRDWLLTAASYNAGPSRVIQRMNLFGSSSYWDIALPVETEKYVPRLIALWIINTNRQFYDVQAHPQGTISFDTLTGVRLAKDLSFATIAKLLGTTPRSVWKLNAEISPYKAVFPAKSGKTTIPHIIRVPKGKGEKLRTQLKAHGYVRK
jgi:membrane-bound lytic murein transglycosylase D